MNSWGILGIIIVGIVLWFIWLYMEEIGLVSLILNVGFAIAGVYIIISWPSNAFAWVFGLLFAGIGVFNSKDMIQNMRNGNSERVESLRQSLKEQIRSDSPELSESQINDIIDRK